jgi:hypothetical protein
MIQSWDSAIDRIQSLNPKIESLNPRLNPKIELLNPKLNN